FVCYLFFVSFVFFFSSRRRHTRFSRDWSSDVCSSDLKCDAIEVGLVRSPVRWVFLEQYVLAAPPLLERERAGSDWLVCVVAALRSEERRVGKECRCWWSADE